MEQTSVTYPPIPEGATFLFENQDKPFAGDTFMERDILNLLAAHKLSFAVETGTCYGSSALWFSEHFANVYTCEAHGPTWDIAKVRLNDRKNVTLAFARSQDWMGAAIAQIKADCSDGSDVLFFLDAHFEQHCPLLDELNIIAAAGIKPVIAIHDFKVPGRPDLGFDTWNGQQFTFEWVKKHIEAIYGRDGYAYNYNSEATGARRGVIYIYPKQ